MLLIDMGNSCIKWCVQKGAHKEYGTLSYSQLKHTADVFAHLHALPVMVASVVGKTAILPALKKFKQITWLLTPDADSPLFKHCYQHTERLGVDRWLNMLASRALQQQIQPTLVVSAGTALTIDVFNQHNQHEGGWILPGFAHTQQCLFSNTHNVSPYQDEQPQTNQVSLQAGCSTTQAVLSGAYRMPVALVQSVLKDYPKHQLYITGGNGDWLAEQLDASYYPNLIFAGMNAVCAG